MLTHHFIRNPVRMLGEAQDQSISIVGKTEQRSRNTEAVDAQRNICSCRTSACCQSSLTFPRWFPNADYLLWPDSPEAWSEVNTLRLAYSTPKVPSMVCEVKISGQCLRLYSVHRKDRPSTSCSPCRAAGRRTAISTAAAATW